MLVIIIVILVINRINYTIDCYLLLCFLNVWLCQFDDIDFISLIRHKCETTSFHAFRLFMRILIFYQFYLVHTQVKKLCLVVFFYRQFTFLRKILNNWLNSFRKIKFWCILAFTLNHLQQFKASVKLMGRLTLFILS